MPRPHRRTRLILAVLGGLALGVLPVDVPLGPSVEPAAADTSFTFDGGGFGHGVGMSQFGLLGMAKAGFTAPQMMAHYYQGTTVAALDGASRIQDLRVRVVERGSTFVTGSGQLQYFVDGAHCAQSPAGEAVEIRASGGGFAVRGAGGTGPDVCVGGAGRTLSVDFGATATTPGAPMRVSGTPCTGGCRYRWGQLAVRGSGASLTIAVERLSMEHYLRGLAEVPSSWPAQALQGQAIAGRSYAEYKALHRRYPAKDPGYDLLANTQDQVYSGYEKEAGAFGAQWVAAVDATAHQVSTAGNQVIEAFYSSSSGGYTENSEYVFAETRSYLRAAPDPYDADPTNPNATWTRSYSGSELGSWVASRYGASIGSVVDLEISGNLGASGRIDRATVALTGTAGSRTMSGNDFRRMVNSYAGSGRTLLSTKLALRSTAPTPPFGSFDSISRGPGGARVSGWAIDPSTTGSIDVHVYVDGRGAAVLRADRSRPDVEAAYPAFGPNHGFSGTAPMGAGSHTVCAYAVGTSSRLLGCKSISISTNPFGSVDAASGSSGRVQLSGWAIDPDTAGATEVHVYVDGRGAAVVRADRSRPDVGRVYPAYGSAHGFSASIGVNEGRHTACAYAINVGAGSNVLLGCRSIDVPQSPFGSLDGAVRSGGGIRVSGWTIDPNTSSAISVHVYVDGSFAGSQTAARRRPDVGAAFPAFGPDHGFDLTVGAAPSGRHTVCAYGINWGPGGNRLLGCRSV